jgi:hypothetical protein
MRRLRFNALINSPLIVAGIHGRIPPRPVGHRAFDAKEPLIVVGDDEAWTSS